MKKIQAFLTVLLIAAGIFSFRPFVFAEETKAATTGDTTQVSAPTGDVKEDETPAASETKTEETKTPDTTQTAPAAK